MIRTCFLSFLVVATTTQAQASNPYPSPSKTHLWKLEEAMAYPRLRVVAGKPVDVIFDRGGADWRWDLEGDSLQSIAPNPYHSKCGEASERYMVSFLAADPPGYGAFPIFIYSYQDNSYWFSENEGFHESLSIYDTTAVWPHSNSIRVLDVETGARRDFDVTGTATSSSVWNGYIAYSVDSLNYGWADRIEVFDLATEATRVAFEGGGSITSIDINEGSLAYVIGGSSVYVEPLDGTGWPTYVPTPAHCNRIDAMRLAGSVGNLVAYAASGCHSGRSELYVSNIDTGTIFFISEISSGFYGWDVQGASIAFATPHRRAYVMLLEEDAMY